MDDNLSRIFKERLFETKKSPDRDWSKIISKAGEELYGEVTSMFPFPEIALCGLVHCLAEIVMCQRDKYKRQRLNDRIRDALRERVVAIERMEEEDAKAGYGEYEKDEPEPEEEEEEPDRPGKPEKPEEGEEIDPEAEIDYKKTGKKNQPEPPGPGGDDDEEEEEDDPDPDQSPWVHPVRESGYRKPTREKQ